MFTRLKFLLRTKSLQTKIIIVLYITLFHTLSLAKNDAKDDAILLIKYLFYLNNDKHTNQYSDLFYCLYDYHCFAYLSQQYGSDERAKE